MTRGNCDNKGSKRKVLRLIFYITAVLVVCTIVAIVVWKSVENSQNSGLGNGVGDGADKITFILNNGEADVVCGTEDEIPSPSKQGHYLYGWYTDESLDTKIEFSSISDILGDENSGKFKNGEYKLYAGWKELMNMTGVRMKDTFFIYDGICHEAEIEGLPDGASVEYLGDDEIVDAGEYEVAAIVRAYGYNDLRIEGKITIGKARVDVSKIKFADKTFTWDGSAKSIVIEGELPSGVSVSYENNGKTEVGEYEIIAHFDCGKNYESIADMKATLTVSAVKYEITFVDEDGTVTVVKMTSGSEVEIPKPKAKRGYNATWSVENFENVNEDITVTPVYVPIVYKIEYDANGGVTEKDSATEYTVEDTVQLKDAVREYYDFQGWYDNPSFEGDRIENIPLNTIGAIMLYAKWEETEYVVEYETYGGYNDTQNENRGKVYVYTVNSGDLELQAPAKRGYDFVRWKDEDGEDITVIRADKPSSFTVYAEWKIITYEIAYELNGGVNAGSNPNGYTVESGNIVLADASKYGYEFLGWYENEEFTGEKTEKINGMECRKIELYAKWENVMYKVEESSDGKIVLTSYNYADFGTELVIPASIDGQKIDEIASGVLANATSVELQGFESINNDAFKNCNKLERLTLPNTMKELNQGLLADCVNLKSLTVPYASNKRIVGENENATYLPLCELFEHNDSNKAGCYEVSVTTAHAASGQAGLIDSLKAYKCYVPESLEEITILGGDIALYALYGLKSLKRVTVLGDCKNIGKRAFAECTNLESAVLPEGIESVHKTAFEGCAKVEVTYAHGDTDEQPETP